MNLLIAFLTFGLWSSVFSIGKMTLEYSPPLFLTSARMLFASFLILSYLVIRNRMAFKITPKQMMALAVYGLLGMYLTNALEFWSLQHLSAAKTCFLYGLTPFLAAFFSYIHFGEKMNPRKWLGLSIGFLGIAPVLAIQTGSEGLAGGIFLLSWPELAMFGAVLCSSYGWVLLRLLVKNVSLLAANGIAMLIAGLFALGHSYLAESWNPLPVPEGSLIPFLQGTIAITFISNVVCTNLYGLLLRKYTATFLSFIGLLSPFFASLHSWVFLGEAPSVVIFMSSGIQLFGLWLVYNAELKQGYIVKSQAPEATASQ